MLFYLKWRKVLKKEGKEREGEAFVFCSVTHMVVKRKWRFNNIRSVHVHHPSKGWGTLQYGTPRMEGTSLYVCVFFLLHFFFFDIFLD